MPLTGTLHDLSISSLIQIFCLERKTTRLLVRRPQEVGFIYFSQGEVWHASAGTFTGLEAVTYLLSWQFGEFNTFGYEEEIPERTIQHRWDQLLLESTTTLDERKSGPLPPPEPIISASQRKREEALEELVLSTISRLEQLYCRFYEERARRHPKAAMELLAMITTGIITLFYDTLQKTPLPETSIKAAHKELSGYFHHLPLTPQGNNIDTPQLVQDLQAAGSLQPEVFARIQANLVKLVEYALFALIATCFQATDIKTELAETCSIFLADVKHAIQQLEF
jgi:hypothetical protein